MSESKPRKRVLIHGIPEEKKEDTILAATEVFKEKMKVSFLKSDDIQRGHRLGNVREGRPRPVLIEFNDIVHRNKVWSSKTSLKGSGVTIYEFLTKTRHDTFVAARQRFGITNCWTTGGTVFVLSADGKKHQVVTLADLNAIEEPATASSSESPSKLPAKTSAAPKRRAAKK